jgi:K+-transporting ATPase ATPase C chain
MVNKFPFSEKLKSSLRQIKSGLLLFALLTLLTGVIYPLLITGIANILFPRQSQGSLVTKDFKIVGSTLIGQDFNSPQYFWGRPSSTSGKPYNAFDPVSMSGSSGSNLGPLSQKLVDDVQSRVDSLHLLDETDLSLIPVDLVTSSASGLDPHISPEAAHYQAARVAQARRMDLNDVYTLIDQYTEQRQFGVLGEPRVNVLLLNMALDIK